MQQMSKRYEKNKVVKRRGQNEHSKQGDKQKQIYILHDETYMDTWKKLLTLQNNSVCICVSSCVCVSV